MLYPIESDSNTFDKAFKGLSNVIKLNDLKWRREDNMQRPKLGWHESQKLKNSNNVNMRRISFQLLFIGQPCATSAVECWQLSPLYRRGEKIFNNLMAERLQLTVTRLARIPLYGDLLRVTSFQTNSIGTVDLDRKLMKNDSVEWFDRFTFNEINSLNFIRI